MLKPKEGVDVSDFERYGFKKCKANMVARGATTYAWLVGVRSCSYRGRIST